jgi:hypothetical protein
MSDDVEQSEPSVKPGRADEESFAEALQAVTDLESLTSDGSGVAASIDPVEEMLLETIEAEAADTHEDGGRLEYIPPTIHDYTERLEEGRPDNVNPVLSWQDSHGHQAPLLSDEMEADLSTVNWPRLLRMVLPNTSSTNELKLFAVVTAPLLACVLLEATSSEHYLSLRLFYSYALSRLLSISYHAIVMFLLLFMPPFQWRTLVLNGSLGWPAAALCFIGVTMSFPLMRVDLHSWEELSALPHYRGVVFWAFGAASSKPFIDAYVQFYINSLTLGHYESRAMDAHRAQTFLRAIASAVRAARKGSERELQASRPKIGGKGLSVSLDDLRSVTPGIDVQTAARSEAINVAPEVRHDTAKHADQAELSGGAVGSGGWAHFFSLLEDLSGPLEFGSEYDDAANLVQARRRALKLFGMLAKHRELYAAEAEGRSSDTGSFKARPPAGGGNVLSREAIVRWLSLTLRQPVEDTTVAAFFKSASAIDEDTFVSCIERCYKEQRMITASVRLLLPLQDMPFAHDAMHPLLPSGCARGGTHGLRGSLWLPTKCLCD